MYQLVVFNLLLDLLLGCTSGGVFFDSSNDDSDVTSQAPSLTGSGNSTGASESHLRARNQAAERSGRIAHFHTLDWSVDSLRHLTVQLEYVRERGDPVIARTVGSFGYVGVLTGVRKGLSVSLNHRSTHDGST